MSESEQGDRPMVEGTFSFDDVRHVRAFIRFHPEEACISSCELSDVCIDRETAAVIAVQLLGWAMRQPVSTLDAERFLSDVRERISDTREGDDE